MRFPIVARPAIVITTHVVAQPHYSNGVSDTEIKPGRTGGTLSAFATVGRRPRITE